jgi:hypothetical protein
MMTQWKGRVIAALCGIGTIGAVAAFAMPATTTAARPHLKVVELFQSQGCSDCPPAEANLNAIAGDPGILALSYGVTYWDQLGWKDTFATPQFTARQWDYAHRRNRANVWTPQVYVDGKADLVGSNRSQLDQTIAQSAVAGPDVTLNGARVTVGAGKAPGQPATVWLVRYDPRTLQVPIRAGENNGRTLPHRNIVRELVALGRWTGPAKSFDIPAAGVSGLASAVLVQEGPGGTIIAAAKG